MKPITQYITEFLVKDKTKIDNNIYCVSHFDADVTKIDNKSIIVIDKNNINKYKDEDYVNQDNNELTLNSIVINIQNSLLIYNYGNVACSDNYIIGTKQELLDYYNEYKNDFEADDIDVSKIIQLIKNI